MAPSTPPPPSRPWFAALTIASISSRVMSPWIASRRAMALLPSRRFAWIGTGSDASKPSTAPRFGANAIVARRGRGHRDSRSSSRHRETEPRRMSGAASRYVHGTSPEEQHRLEIMNQILNDSSTRELGLRGGERIVDFGSGLGQLTRAMVRAGGPACRAVGIERSAEQIEAARTLAREASEGDRVEFRQ